VIAWKASPQGTTLIAGPAVRRQCFHSTVAMPVRQRIVAFDGVQHQFFVIAEDTDHVAVCGQTNRRGDDRTAAWSAINEVTKQDNGIAWVRHNGFKRCAEGDGAAVYISNRDCSMRQGRQLYIAGQLYSANGKYLGLSLIRYILRPPTPSD
jgi:hypothetical protein